MKRPVILVHGYSDRARSLETWRDGLEQRGHDVSAIHLCEYETLTNEITIKDIAEGFDRALRHVVGLDNNEEFDAVVHSTGMLVLRSWLVSDPRRVKRLKHLIGLAPATFGSPLAHKGRSWIGAAIKGRKQFGPDFLNAGDQVLDGLELGSRFTWDLAHADLLGERTFYGAGPDTPYVFSFCGTDGYSGLKGWVNPPGSDGTVRLAGCALNTRKVVIDLTDQDPTSRYALADWTNTKSPLISVPGHNHSSILREPSVELQDMVAASLSVSNAEELSRWYSRGDVANCIDLGARRDPWQQFIVRAVDERGDPISDYNIELLGGNGARKEEIEAFDAHVHVYRADPSLRCFHVQLDKIDTYSYIGLRINASSGTDLVAYHGYVDSGSITNTRRRRGWWDAQIDISNLLNQPRYSFFYPLTTTLLEIRLDREPMPLIGRNRLTRFI